MKTYFIKEGYQINNKFIYDNDTLSKSNYWTKDQIERNFNAAFYVYDFAKKVIIKNNQIKSILDIGCGAGIKLSKIIAPLNVEKIIGIDSFSAIKNCKENYKFGEFYGIDFDNEAKLDVIPSHEKVDFIICSEVIEHLENPDNILNIIKKYSHKDTLIVLSTPERNNTRGKKCNSCPNKYHVREWSFSEFKQYIESSGFIISDHILLSPIKAYFSIYYFKQYLINLVLMRNYIKKGTQLMLLKIQ